MAYFQRDARQEPRYTRRFAPVRSAGEPENTPEAEYEADLDSSWADDGFDELEEAGSQEEIDFLDEEELRAERRRKFRLAADLGDLGAVIAGVVLILLLVAFLINMINFVTSDFTQNFSLFQTRL